MPEIRETSPYAECFAALRDHAAKARIDIRIRRLSQNNPGEVRPVGDGVSELRIHSGAGYRVYFIKQGKAVVILLARGSNSTQQPDIRQARGLARNP